MQEKRCDISGAVIFFPEPQEQEIIQIKKENYCLKKHLLELEERLNKLELKQEK